MEEEVESDYEYKTHQNLSGSNEISKYEDDITSIQAVSSQFTHVSEPISQERSLVYGGLNSHFPNNFPDDPVVSQYNENEEDIQSAVEMSDTLVNSNVTSYNHHSIDLVTSYPHTSAHKTPIRDEFYMEDTLEMPTELFRDDNEGSDADDHEASSLGLIAFEQLKATLPPEEQVLLDIDINSPPIPPKRSMQPYFIFASEVREDIKTELGTSSVADMAKAIGSRWSALTLEEKEKYSLQAAEGKAKYDVLFTEYQEKKQKYQLAISLRERLFSSSSTSTEDGLYAENEELTSYADFPYGTLPLGRIKSLVQSDGERYTKEAILFITRASELFAGYLGSLISQYALVTRKISIRNAFWQHTMLSNPDVQFLKHCHFLFQTQFETSQSELQRLKKIESGLSKGKKQQAQDEILRGVGNIHAAFFKTSTIKPKETGRMIEEFEEPTENRSELRVTGDIFSSFNPFASSSSDSMFGISSNRSSTKKIRSSSPARSKSKTKTKTIFAQDRGEVVNDEDADCDDDAAEIQFNLDEEERKRMSDETLTASSPLPLKIKDRKKTPTSKEKEKLVDTSDKNKRNLLGLLKNAEKQAEAERDDELSIHRQHELEQFKNASTFSTSKPKITKRVSSAMKKESKKGVLVVDVESDDDYIEGVDFTLDENGQRQFISSNNISTLIDSRSKEEELSHPPTNSWLSPASKKAKVSAFDSGEEDNSDVISESHNEVADDSDSEIDHISNANSKKKELNKPKRRQVAKRRLVEEDDQDDDEKERAALELKQHKKSTKDKNIDVRDTQESKKLKTSSISNTEYMTDKKTIQVSENIKSPAEVGSSLAMEDRIKNKLDQFMRK